MKNSKIFVHLITVEISESGGWVTVEGKRDGKEETGD